MNDKIFFCVFVLLILIFLINTASIVNSQVPSVPSSLIRLTDTSQWSPPSPDPAGISYLSDTNSLLISDSEVDEMPIYQNANVYQSSLNGNLIRISNTLSFSHEPTDVAVDLPKNLYYFSDDNQKKIFVVDLGSDHAFATGDDRVRSFSTLDFNCTDPEGIALGAGKLYVACGIDRNIVTLSPGGNGIFDGVAPSGDDQATSFSTAVFNQMDPEGIEYNSLNNSLFIVSTSARSVAEVTTTGIQLRNIDISPFNIRVPAGLEYAPASNNPQAKSLYIVARGVDNNVDPTENDGKIYEISFAASSPNNSPTPSIRLTNTPTPFSASPTRTPTLIQATNPIHPTVSPTPILLCVKKSLGDANCDGLIDLIDFEIWRREFTGSAITRNADYNADGFVNLIDFEFWRRAFSG